MGELVKPLLRDEFRLGAPVDYRRGLGNTSELARRTVDRTGIVRVVNFPPDMRTLVEFCSTFGPLMPKYRATGTAPEDYIGDVRIRTDIPPEDRLATERDGELRPHTAKSWGLQRPRYFGILMINPGWTNQSFGMNGESRFVRAGDAVDELQRRFPQTADEDFHLLTTTPVEFMATHIRDDVARMAIVFPVDSISTLGLRYKENMRDVLIRLAPPTLEGKRYVQAVTMIAVIEHIPPAVIPNVLVEIHRALEDNGLFVVRVPSTLQPVRDKHYQHFTPDSLQHTLEQGGHFTVQEMVGNHDTRVDWADFYVRITNKARQKGLSDSDTTIRADEMYHAEVKICDPYDAKRLLAICRKK
ncbi:TauD/TfdA family dioxygenase [Candidatus Roizmanbacteria bacterium]|nr:TauD/TfdA family dioxygenase [Candidatus Roizmanbacteria bacterium]